MKKKEKTAEQKREELQLRVSTNSSAVDKHILVCRGTGCTSSKSQKIIEQFEKEFAESGL